MKMRLSSDPMTEDVDKIAENGYNDLRRFGGVAQLARAHGSYPWCRQFKSVLRYVIRYHRDMMPVFYIMENFQKIPAA
jgi:hypothetical protein